MIRKYSLIVLVGVSGFLGLNVYAFAEGGCPPGQYPIGDSRAPGCAPIPGSGVGAGTQGPVATGKWLLTWGAISTSAATGDAGAGIGKLSKSEALREARENCEKYGAKDCSKGFAYKNQCVALATPHPGSGGRVSVSAGGSVGAAKGYALDLCKKNGGGACTIVYSECTEPIFKAY